MVKATISLPFILSYRRPH